MCKEQDGESDQGEPPREHGSHCRDGACPNGQLIDELTRVPDKALVDERWLAAALRVTPRTVRRMVARYELPPPVRLAGRSVWMVGHILGHIQASVERAVDNAQREARRLHNLRP